MLGNQVRKNMSLPLWQCQKIAENEGVLRWEKLFIYSHFTDHYLRFVLCQEQYWILGNVQGICNLVQGNTSDIGSGCYGTQGRVI